MRLPTILIGMVNNDLGCSIAKKTLRVLASACVNPRFCGRVPAVGGGNPYYYDRVSQVSDTLSSFILPDDAGSTASHVKEQGPVGPQPSFDGNTIHIIQ
jgi:hypothetical protein